MGLWSKVHDVLDIRRVEEIERSAERNKYEAEKYREVLHRPDPDAERRKPSRGTYGDISGDSVSGLGDPSPESFRGQLKEVMEDAVSEEDRDAVVKHFLHVLMRRGWKSKPALRKLVRDLEALGYTVQGGTGDGGMGDDVGGSD